MQIGQSVVVKKEKAVYNVIIGERSNGKTYAVFIISCPVLPPYYTRTHFDTPNRNFQKFDHTLYETPDCRLQ